MYRTLAAIMIGNQFYDKFAGNSGQMFGVQDTATKMQQARALGSIHMSGELPASITREQIPSACLPYYFLQACNMTKTACIYIINDKTVAFIPTRNGITDNYLACEQAHLIGKGGGAAIASRRSRREEWGEEK